MPRRVVSCLALLALTGCGAQQQGGTAEDFRGDERAVAEAVERLRTAAQAGDATEICREVLARELVQRFEQAGGQDCPVAVREAVRDADTFDLRVQDVTVDGQRATAKVQATTGERTQTDTVTLVREGDRWRISALQAQA